MSNSDNYISNGSKSFINPIINKQDIIESYDGPFYYDFNFGQQTKNYYKIKSIFDKHNIYPTRIIYVKWKRTHDTMKLTSFIVMFSNPTIIWRKYQSNGLTASHNRIFIKDTFINTSRFDEEFLVNNL